MKSVKAARPWVKPRLVSVPVPVVEELLAHSYKRKAELWAEAAGMAKGRSTAAER